MSDTSLETAGNKAMLTPEQQRILNAGRQAAAKPVMPIVPELCLYNTMQKVEGVTRGEYYIKKWNPEKKANDITPIGANPNVVVLLRRYSYSYYDEDLKRLVAWTSEFDGFTNLDAVTLFHNDGTQARIERQGTYKDMKPYIQQRYSVEKPGGGRKNLMKFSNILYVLCDGKVYRMFVSNASAAGVENDSANADFQKPQPHSLIDYFETVGENRPSAFFEGLCKLGSRFVDGERQYYLMQFDLVRHLDETELPGVIDTYGKLQGELETLERMELSRMGGSKSAAGSSADAPSSSIPPIQYDNPGLQVEDLPF